jgi:hypothetical protein
LRRVPPYAKKGPDEEFFALGRRSKQSKRIRAGLERARAAGKKLGRPRIDTERANAILKEVAKGQDSMRLRLRVQKMPQHVPKFRVLRQVGFGGHE